MTATVVADPRAVLPVPSGRARWRIIAYQRQFSTALPTALGQLDGARGRRLEQKLNAPAQFTFTLDGHDPAAASLLELATDILALRWHEPLGRDVPMFRGILDHSEDQLSESSATVTFTAHDYFAMLSRRFMSSSGALNWGTTDQDLLVSGLLAYATTNLASPTNVQFAPGSFLPLSMARRNPDGSQRLTYSGQLRDRKYQPATVYAQAIDDLAHVINGFDYDVLPGGPSTSYDTLRVFYPQQGVTRNDLAFAYGANISALTRTVSSADYVNYAREIGNKASSDPNAPQLFSDQWNIDANNVTVNPVGTFMRSENASDVSLQQTLDDKAAGVLATNGVLVPTYTLGLRPGAYTYGNPNMGDAIPLYVNEGRLAVNTTVRVVGIDYDIGEDGDENIVLTVGRPPATLAKLLRSSDRDIDALARR